MAYDARATAVYPGRSNHSIELYVRRDQTDSANNRSTYAWALFAHRNGAWGGTYYSNPLPWSVWVAGQGFTGSAGLPFSSSVAHVTLGSGTTGWVQHDAAGNLNLAIAASHGGAQFGVASTGDVWWSADRIPKAPSAPSFLSVSNVGVDSMTLNWGDASDNGASIDQMLLRYSLDPGFVTYVDLPNAGNVRERMVSGLTPGTTYYWNVYAHNSAGYSPPTSTLAQNTIPSSPPGISVSAAISGLQATLILSPPGATSGVTRYNIQRRLVGTTAPVTNSSTGNTTFVSSGLQPGLSYEWRADAEIGGYTSPWSGWIPATMPNPNTVRGEYFDGDTPDTTNANYSWLGTPENSKSVATGYHPLGWMVYGADNPTGSTGVISRSVGGLFGQYAVQVSVQSDATAVGLVMGVVAEQGAEVEAGSTYWGSVHLRVGSAFFPGVFQPGIRWFNAAHVQLGTTWGDIVYNASTAENFTWKRYSVVGEAPAGAVVAAPVIRDAGSVDHPFSLTAGMRMLLDGAMVSLGELFPYFDGSSSDIPGYDYQWMGTPNESVSIRYSVAVPLTDPLSDPDCSSLPKPPTPPSIPSDCIEEVGKWRRYVVQVPASEVRLWTATLPTLVLTTNSVAERQVRIRFFPNPGGLPPREVDTEIPEGELILTYIPPQTRITLDGVARRVLAEVNGATPIPASQLLYGSGGTPATWPELTCGVDYLIALDVPTEAPSGNLSTELFLTQRV